MDGAANEVTHVLMCAAGAAPPPLPVVTRIDHVVAADGGLSVADEMGLVADVVIGDLDSADPQLLAAARTAGARIIPHPQNKDETDWELALRYVLDAGHRRVTIVGGAGGRFDHLLANALVLTNDDFAPLEITWHVGRTTIRVARQHGPVTVHGTPGDLVSLLAVGRAAAGVRTTGLRWALTGEPLPPATSRGVSNEMVAPTATVTVESGALLVIHQKGDQ